jgi:hypothetical protein
MLEGGDLPPQKKAFFLLERLWYYGKKIFLPKQVKYGYGIRKKTQKNNPSGYGCLLCRGGGFG